MTIAYPQSPSTKKSSLELPPVAPTPILRADAALADAHRLFGSGMGQAFTATMWLAIFSLGRLKDSDIFSFATILVLLAAIMVVLVWEGMQGTVFGKPVYSSGLPFKPTGTAKIVMIAGISVLGLTAMMPIGMFLAWENNVDFPQALLIMQGGGVLAALLFSVSMFSRAISALNYARLQLASVDHAATP